MKSLVRYEAARKALTELQRVDEVKDIRDKAAAMQMYARQAKDPELIDHATEIRMRAEIRAGELLAEMAERKERHAGKAPKGSRVATPTPQPKLSDIGVSKSQSSRWQRLAALSKEDQEEKIKQAKRKAEAAVAPTIKSVAQKTKAKPSRAVSPTDRCTMRVRSLILEFMDMLVATEFRDFFAALHDEIDDLEKLAERKREDGHHAARKSA